MPTLTTFIQHSTGSPDHINQTRNKRNPNIKEVKLPLLGDDMILYIENPKDNTKKLLELINEFGKAEGFKINMQKLLYFYTLTTKLSEREIKTAIPSTTALKRTKYLEINLTYKVKVLYSENHDTNERN